MTYRGTTRRGRGSPIPRILGGRRSPARPVGPGVCRCRAPTRTEAGLVLVEGVGKTDESRLERVGDAALAPGTRHPPRGGGRRGSHEAALYRSPGQTRSRGPFSLRRRYEPSSGVAEPPTHSVSANWASCASTLIRGGSSRPSVVGAQGATGQITARPARAGAYVGGLPPCSRRAVPLVAVGEPMDQVKKTG